MQDQPILQPLPAARPQRSGRGLLLVALLAFVLGAGLAGWLAWRGDLDMLWRVGREDPAPAAQPYAAAPAAPPSAAAAAMAASPLALVEGRLALLEERMSRLDLQAEAASGNAARAEALLIAFAARRMVEKGAPLGHLEDQLTLRFADAQPNAVRTIIEAGNDPVTLDELLGRLDVLAPTLTTPAANDDAWVRVKRELASLFIVRRDAAPAATVRDRIERAKIMLSAGRVESAIAEVQRMPGASEGQAWIAAAQRYDAAQQALDLIETTAMLEPRRLNDSRGSAVEQTSPLAPAPAPAASAAPAT